MGGPCPCADLAHFGPSVVPIMEQGIGGNRGMVACPYCMTPPRRAVDAGDAWRIYSCQECLEAYLVRPDKGGSRTTPARPPASLNDSIAAGSVMHGVIRVLDESIQHLPTVPDAPQRVLSAIHDPITTSADLAALINEDAVFSMRVLHTSNSVTFAGRQSITDLRRACARLGLRNLANVAHVVAQGHLYRSVNPAYAEIMEQFWQHAVATARLAEAFAGAVPGVPQNSIFLMALVHDIGKTVLLDAITNRYKGRAGRLKDSTPLLLQTLTKFAPYAGLRVVRHWSMGPEVCFATFYSALPAAAPDLFKPSAYLIALASAVADACGYGVAPDAALQAESLAAELAQQLGITNLGKVIASADDEIAPYLDLAKA